MSRALESISIKSLGRTKAGHRAVTLRRELLRRRHKPTDMRIVDLATARLGGSTPCVDEQKHADHLPHKSSFNGRT